MLLKIMTDTASTTRPPAISGGKVGTPVTHLEDVKITPVMLPSATGQHQIRAAIGMESSAVQIYEAYTTAHEHTDDSVTVDALPDIREGDRLIVGSTTYNVRWSEQQPATTSFGATLLIYLTEDKRA